MRYHKDPAVNEQNAVIDGMRHTVTREQLQYYFNHSEELVDGYVDNIEEALLDILNDSWPVADVVDEINEKWEE